VKIAKILAIFILVLGGVFFLRSNSWEIRKIDCWQNKNPCPSEVWSQLMNLTLGKNIIFLKKKKIIEEFLNTMPTFKDLKIKKKFPNELIFEVKERRGVAALVVQLTVTEGEEVFSERSVFETEEDFYIVDEEGFLLAKEKKSDLPLILLTRPLRLNIGQKIEEKEIIQAINFLTILRLNLLEPKIAKVISPYSLEVWLEKDIKVVFSSKKESQIQIDSLQFILSRAKIEGRIVRKIDLRFDKPVVNYE